MQQMKRHGLWMEILIGGDGDVGDEDVEDEQTWLVDGGNFRSVVVDPFGNF